MKSVPVPHLPGATRADVRDIGVSLVTSEGLIPNRGSVYAAPWFSSSVRTLPSITPCVSTSSDSVTSTEAPPIKGKRVVRVSTRRELFAPLDKNR